MKTLNVNLGKIERGMIVMFLAFLLSYNMYSQYALNNNDVTTFRDEYISRNYSDVAETFHHLPVAEDIYIEEILLMEEWMLHPANWLGSSHKALILNDEMFTEQEANFESWMFSTSWINPGLYNDEEINYESWMFTPLMW